MTVEMICFLAASVPEVLGSQTTFPETPSTTSSCRLNDQKSHNQCKTRGFVLNGHLETETLCDRHAILSRKTRILETLRGRERSYPKEEELILDFRLQLVMLCLQRIDPYPNNIRQACSFILATIM